MTQVVERSGAIDHDTRRYLEDFERVQAARDSREPAWLSRIRKEAIARFGELGFPTTRQEEWRFTSVAPIAETPFVLASPNLSVTGQPAGIRLEPLASLLATSPEVVQPHLTRLASYANHPFIAWNTAFLQDGVFVGIPSNLVIETPIELLFTSAVRDAPTVFHPRVLIVAGENSQVRIVERYVGPSGSVYFTNAVTEVIVGPNAVIDHYKLQEEGARAFHMGSMHVLGGRDSTFSSHSISVGGALVRNEVTAVLDGKGIDCTLNGLYLADGSRLVDNHTTIDHARPHCGSHEVYKGILGDRARAVFNGKIIVRPDAQKTDAKQTNKALLLSDDAQINTKPQLEIFANDVRCTHGAAVGQLDEDAIFYLRSRGLSHDAARSLLIRAFVGDILERVKVESLREHLYGALLDRLPLQDSKKVAP